MGTLNSQLTVLTQPGADGNQTISLAADFDPKAVILWASPLAADGTAIHTQFGVGFGTYRGSVVQQRYNSIRALDASSAADTARGMGTDALLVLLTNGVNLGTRDLEIDLVSMQSGATSQVVINWTNRHTTASIRIFMLILGGSDITDALVDDFTMTTVSTTQDETVVSGFGKPDLLFASAGYGFSDTAGHGVMTFGFAKQGEDGRGYGFAQSDASAASVASSRQRSDRFLLYMSDPNADRATGRLDTTVTNWPTDGFRVLYDSNPLSAHTVSYLALRTTAQIITGSGVAPIAGGLPVVQDNACGFAPKLGLVFGWNGAASTVRRDSDSPVHAGFGIGAYDGTTEAWAGFTEQDAAATMNSNSQQSIAKVLKNYSADLTLKSEADGSFSGNNFRLSWNDIDTVACQYQWLALGDAAGGVTHDGAAALAGTGALAAAGLREAIVVAALSGSGALSAAAVREALGAAALAGLGELNASGVREAQGASTLLGVGSLSAAAVREALGAAALVGLGSLVADGVVEGPAVLGAAALSGAGALSADAVREAVGAATMTGTGALSADAVREAVGAVTLTGTGALSASAVLEAIGVASLIGLGSLSADSVRQTFGVAALSGAGSLTAAGAAFPPLIITALVLIAREAHALSVAAELSGLSIVAAFQNQLSLEAEIQ